MNYKIEDGYITAYYEDNTAYTMPYVGENNLKDLYIISKNPRNRFKIEEKPIDLEEWEKPTDIPTRIKNIDWINLKAKIYNQFGDLMDLQPIFTIEGTGARIEDGKIVEDVVDNDTSYFIVARYGDLEERQERFLYAPVEPQPNELDMANRKIDALVSEQEITNDLLQELILNIYQ